MRRTIARVLHRIADRIAPTRTITMDVNNDSFSWAQVVRDVEARQWTR